MLKRIKERISVFTVKNPSATILIGILILNIVLFFAAAGIISLLAPKTSGRHDFWSSVFYTVSMVLDAGCINYVISDIGEASVALILACIITVLIGMITFTGAVVGYVTNVISEFIQNSKSGNRALKAYGHTIILNWNSRASEIVNDLLYTGQRELVVVLSSQNVSAIENEIDERLAGSIKNDENALREACKDMPLIPRICYYLKNRTRNRVTVIVREGETSSTKQLNDISISQASSIIILTKEYQSEICKYDDAVHKNTAERGNANTIKTLVQVAEMTSNENSADAQTIIVEAEDEWTAQLVNRIIAHKEKLSKCHIIPVYVNRVLGQILSQFSIMPELNTVYSELFSNRGAEFFCKPSEWVDDIDAAGREYILTHRYSIPLTILKTASGNHSYAVANVESDCDRGEVPFKPSLTVQLNKDYHLPVKNIVIIGHNSKCRDIMNGFNAFCNEHGKDILRITIIDDEKSFERMGNYDDYPYIVEKVKADVYDAEIIRNAIEKAIDSSDGDTSLLILSDDNTTSENIDSAALTYLIYVQDIIFARQEQDPNFRRESIDVIVEILNPKNYDVVHNYSVNNVIISNRYISKMVTQIGRKQALFEFYSDILTYDDANAQKFVSKELYAKEISRFFAADCPPVCSARELIFAVFEASPSENKAIVLGYSDRSEKTHLFTGDLDAIQVDLSKADKLIVYSAH